MFIELGFLVLFVQFSESYPCLEQDSFINLCGRCVGGVTGIDDMNGLDRCGVCDGEGSCVGCDGLVNSSRKTDFCGLCLPIDAPQWNDCSVIAEVTPSVIDRAVHDAYITLTLTGAGISPDKLTEANCRITSSDGSSELKIEETSLQENDITLKVAVGEQDGNYSASCTGLEGSGLVTVVDGRRWNTLSASPIELRVDEAVKIELEVSVPEVRTKDVWCYVDQGRFDVTTLSAVWISDTKVLCSTFTPKRPIKYIIGVAATEMAAVEDDRGKSIELAARSQRPKAIDAMFSPDLTQIWIKFDQNIQSSTDCSKQFTADTFARLGSHSSCITSGDMLIVTMGADTRIGNKMEISLENDVRRIGGDDPSLAPSAEPSSLIISPTMVFTPALSLSVPQSFCHKHKSETELKVVPMGNQNLNYKFNMVPPSESRGSQRANMRVWKVNRDIERDLNKKARQNSPLIMNGSELLPNAEYGLDVHGTNHLGQVSKSTSPVKLTNSRVSITLVTSPSVTTITAEALVTYCDETTMLAPLKYTWYLDGTRLHQDGRLLIIDDASPGIYNVTCHVVNLDEPEVVLGTAWITARILQWYEEVVINPSSIAVGTMDAIHLFTNMVAGRKIKWRCRTDSGSECYVPGRRRQRIEQVVNVGEESLEIPPGHLPVGRYIWSIDGVPSSEAEVIIVTGTPIKLSVLHQSAVVDPRKPISLTGEANRLVPDCKLRWSVVHQTGFNYFNLVEDVGLGDTIKITPDDMILTSREIPLTVPGPTGKWTGLFGDSSYMLRLSGTCPAGTPDVHVDTTLLVNSPPKLTFFTVEPMEGESLSTLFQLSTATGRDVLQDFPLSYLWSYNTNNARVPLRIAAYATNFSTHLPPGDGYLSVRVCDIRKSCLSYDTAPIKLLPPQQIDDKNLEALEKQMNNSLMSGDYVEGLGLSSVLLLSLSAVDSDDARAKLSRISETTENGIEARVGRLSALLETEPKLASPSFDFLELSISTLKYIPKKNGILQTLTDFKNKILTKMDKSSSRTKREARIGERVAREIYIPQDKVKSMLDLDSMRIKAVDNSNNRRQLLDNVHKCMMSLCLVKPTSPIVIASEVVTLGVKKLLIPSDINTEISVPDSSNKDKSAVITLKHKFTSPQVCLASAVFSADYVSNTSSLRVSDVYEIQLIHIDKKAFHNSSSMDPLTDITLHISSSVGDIQCKMWSQQSWVTRCKTVTVSSTSVRCQCRDFGYFAAFTNVEPTTNKPSTTTTKQTTVTEKTTVGTTVTTVGTPATTVGTTVTTVGTTATTVRTPATTVGTTEPVTNLPETTIATQNIILSQLSFKIDADMDQVVGGNEELFIQHIKQEIIRQLNCSSSNIYNISVAKGSIVVTVQLIDVEDRAAERIAVRLAEKLMKGELHLTDLNQKPLDVPPQDVLDLRNSMVDNTSLEILLITGILIGSSLLLISFFAVGTFMLKRRQTQLVNGRQPKLVLDETPTYSRFHDEVSLSGSLSSLTRFRREAYQVHEPVF